MDTQASDIHIEPFEDRLRIRYRYDGVLHEAESPPSRLTAAITSRIKTMAKLDIAERRLPQDGRIRLAVRGQDVDFRISTLPALHGETVVVRVLDRSAVTFDYAKLGLSDQVVSRLVGALDLPNGIVLITGPTGSGKTTTLYTGLLALNSVTRKVIKVEDPMPAFRYVAISATGELERGVMDVRSEAELVARLRRHGSIPMGAELDRGGGSWLAGLLRMEFGRGAALRAQELANVTRELAVMLAAGPGPRPRA